MTADPDGRLDGVIDAAAEVVAKVLRNEWGMSNTTWEDYELEARLVLTAALPDVIAAAKAAAWDEGYALDWTGGMNWTNPYRKADR